MWLTCWSQQWDWKPSVIDSLNDKISQAEKNT